MIAMKMVSSLKYYLNKFLEFFECPPGIYLWILDLYLTKKWKLLFNLNQGDFKYFLIFIEKMLNILWKLNIWRITLK